MKIMFCVFLICLWNFLLVLASSPEVVKRSAEDFNPRFQGNFDGSNDYYHHRYHPHHHLHRHPRPHSILQPYLPRPTDHNIPPEREGYPWKRPEFEPPRNDHYTEHSFEEPTWNQNPWNGPSDTWSSSTDSSPGTHEYTDFDKEAKGNQDKEYVPDCHCKFENVGSRTIVTVSVKTTPTMTTSPTTTSTSTTTMTTTSMTPSTSSTSSTTEFDWNTYVEKELADELSKTNSAGTGVIDIRLKNYK